jgi:hypothetical protein
MPKFIKTNTIVNVNRHGVESDRQVLFTDDEVISRVLLNPSLVIEVTESHASQVIRVQGKYQEISEETLELIDEKRIEQTEKLDGALSTPPEEVDEIEEELVAEEDVEVEDDVEDEAPLTFGKK